MLDSQERNGLRYCPLPNSCGRRDFPACYGRTCLRRAALKLDEQNGAPSRLKPRRSKKK